MITSIGPIEKGDTVWYPWPVRRRGVKVMEIEWAVVSGRSHLNPNSVFGRNHNGKARVIDVSTITRIQRNEP